MNDNIWAAFEAELEKIAASIRPAAEIAEEAARRVFNLKSMQKAIGPKRHVGLMGAGTQEYKAGRQLGFEAKMERKMAKMETANIRSKALREVQHGTPEQRAHAAKWLAESRGKPPSTKSEFGSDVSSKGKDVPDLDLPKAESSGMTLPRAAGLVGTGVALGAAAPYAGKKYLEERKKKQQYAQYGYSG